MLYNLVLARNKPYSNTSMAHLPEEIAKEWDKTWSKEAMEPFGIKWVVYCDSTWCNEEYSVFAINTYKDITARIADWKRIEKVVWY